MFFELQILPIVLIEPAPIPCRGHTGKFGELSCKMALGMKTQILTNGLNIIVGILQEIFTAFYLFLHNKLMQRNSLALFEHLGQIRRRGIQLFCNILNSNGLMQMFIDVIFRPFGKRVIVLFLLPHISAKGKFGINQSLYNIIYGFGPFNQLNAGIRNGAGYFHIQSVFLNGTISQQSRITNAEVFIISKRIIGQYARFPSKINPRRDCLTKHFFITIQDGSMLILREDKGIVKAGILLPLKQGLLNQGVNFFQLLFIPFEFHAHGYSSAKNTCVIHFCGVMAGTSLSTKSFVFRVIIVSQ